VNILDILFFLYYNKYIVKKLEVIIIKPIVSAIDKLINEKFDGNQSKFAREINVDRSQVSKFLKDGTGIGAKFLGKFMSYCKRENEDFEEYISLPNIDYSPVATQHKAIEEMEEAINRLKGFNLINKMKREDLTKEEIDILINEVIMELQDVNVCMDITLLSLSEAFDIDLKKLKEMSENKMRERRYITEEDYICKAVL
jgi:transcriptional regulator with XRE-family HTH domain